MTKPTAKTAATMKRSLAVSVLSLVVPSTYAFERSLIVVNESDQSIAVVQASPDYMDEWGPDRLGTGVAIAPGGELPVRFDIENDHCMFDVRIIAANEFEREYSNVDLCESPSYRVVFAGGRTFTVENRSDQAIFSVQASMDYLSEWGGDRLGDEVIMPSDEFVIQVDSARGHCLFNVRLVTEDELEQEYEGVNLCESDRVIYPPPAPPVSVEVVSRRDGEQFRDCADWNCPWMVAVKAGSYQRGSTQGNDDEIPVTKVTIAHNFAVGLYEVSVGQFRYFVQSTGHSAETSCEVNQRGRWAVHEGMGWENPGFSQIDSHPVVCVSWEDATAYVQWLRQETQRPYRLLTEAEWEYLGGGTDTAIFKASGQANCKGCGSRWDGKGTAPVGMFPADRWGLHELYGNAWEWVQDCYTPGYSGAPRDGSAWELVGCAQRVRRGGSWATRPERLRAALRNSENAVFRSSKLGFRVAQTLDPSSVSSPLQQAVSVPVSTRQTESYPSRTDRPSIDSDYRLTFRASPVYPKAAERENIQGHVVVQFTVTAAGTVRDPIVVDAAPSSVFNGAAIEAVRKFRYSPRMVNGQPVEVKGVRTRFRFRISD